jgi:hypothetical protein
MNAATTAQGLPTSASIPAELLELRERIGTLPEEIRAELEPLADDACEQARFRGRALSLAREALEQFRLELSAAKFDLDITRREREGLRRLIEGEV